MNDTNNASTDPHHQWLHYYQQTTTAMPSGGGTTMHGFSDTAGTIVTSSFTTNNTSTPSISTSLISTDDHAHLNPQTAKPIRRRSRAPRRTPTTLLNASTTNFRSLVQQFTGCQNMKSSASYGSQKGPVNLSFGNQNNHQMIGTSSRIAPLGSEFFYNQPINQVIHPQLQQQQQQQEMYENLQVNNVNNNNMQSDGLGDFSIDDVTELHELMDESSSFSTGDNKQDGSYYF